MWPAALSLVNAFKATGEDGLHLAEERCGSLKASSLEADGLAKHVSAALERVSWQAALAWLRHMGATTLRAHVAPRMHEDACTWPETARLEDS